MAAFRFRVFLLVLFAGSGTLASAQLLLDNFSTMRTTGQGANLWAPYLGEDPDQTWSLTTIGGVSVFQVVGSTTLNTVIQVKSISNTNPAVFTTTTTPLPIHNGDRIQTLGITGIGSGCAAMNQANFSNTATLLSSNSFSIAGLDGRSCTYSGSGATAQACYEGDGCGVYQNFIPLNSVGNYSYPASWASNWIQSGSWANSVNRLRFMTNCNKSVTRRSDNGGDVDTGTYIHDPANANSQQGAHYYHQHNPNVYAGQWTLWEDTRLPQHEVSAPDNNWNHPEDPEYWNPNSTSFGNGPVHYLSGITRFYFDTGMGMVGGVNSINAWSGSTCSFASYYFDTVAGEPESYVASRTATYNGTAYEVTWDGPHNLTGNQTTYQVVYATSDIKTLGFSHATSGGTVQNPGGAYYSTIWKSPSMAQAPTVYIGIRPQMLVTNAYTVGGLTAINTEVDSFLTTGDQVTIAGVGGCTSANGTWNVSMLPAASFNETLPGGGTLSNIVVTGSTTATANTVAAHGLKVGQTILIVSATNFTTGYYKITNVPSNTSFQFVVAAMTSGTYTDANLGIYALSAFTLQGSSGCNASYASGGTVTATSDTKNFAEIRFDQSPSQNPPQSALTCDLNNDGVVNILDVLLMVGQVLGPTPCSNTLDGTSTCTIVDVDRVATAAGGAACRIGS
jgi:hypothetical protein